MRKTVGKELKIIGWVEHFELWLDKGHHRALFYSGIFGAFVLAIVIAALSLVVIDEPRSVLFDDEPLRSLRLFFFLFLGLYVALFLGGSTGICTSLVYWIVRKSAGFSVGTRMC
jgi:hypothetical protein